MSKVKKFYVLSKYGDVEKANYILSGYHSVNIPCLTYFPVSKCANFSFWLQKKYPIFTEAKKNCATEGISSSFTTSDRQKQEHRNKWEKPFTE